MQKHWPCAQPKVKQCFKPTLQLQQESPRPLAKRWHLGLNSNKRMNQTQTPTHGPTPISHGAATADRILNAAERLFMQHGFDGASMRHITAEAGVNLAAVNYHFGSKESLMQEVFKRRLDQLNRERMRALDALEAAAGGKPIKPTKILDAFFGTLLRIAKTEPNGGPTFLKLLGRTLTEPTDFIRAFLAHEYQEVLDRYKAALFKALPNVPEAEIVWRFHFMLGATSYAIAGTDSLKLVTSWQDEESGSSRDTRKDSHHDIDRLMARLMSFLVGGLRAPLPDFSDIPAPARASNQPQKNSSKQPRRLKSARAA